MSSLEISPFHRSGAPTDAPRLLALDDHHGSRLFLQHALYGHYRVDAVDTAEAALNRARNTRYDGFLFDIVLQGSQSGVDVAAQLRSEKDYASAPFIAITALSRWAHRQRSLSDTHFDAFVIKPFNQEEVLGTLGRFFE